MTIPDNLHFMGQDWEVKFVDNLTNATDNVGELHPRTLEIKLQRPTATIPRPGCAVDQTFMHELTHLCLYKMNHKLWTDENFVDLFASMWLHLLKDNDLLR